MDQSPLLDSAELKSMRESLGLSMSWVARALNVQERSIVRWEDGARVAPAAYTALLLQLQAAGDRLVADAPEHLATTGEQVWLVPRIDSDEIPYTVRGLDLPGAFYRAIGHRVRLSVPGIRLAYPARATDE